MTAGLILAVDQGTTNTKALAIAGDGKVVATASVPMTVSYPRPGWAEQSADDIWSAVASAIGQVVEAAGSPIDAVAISNQRETIVVWDASSGRPVAPAIVWQCRRSADICDNVRKRGFADLIVNKTGLALDPLFPAAKIAWILDHTPGARHAAQEGRLRAGTVDAWLLWNLTDGKQHATDHSNASRTQLFDTGALLWDADLRRIFDVPFSLLPQVLPSDSLFGVTRHVPGLKDGTPIHAMVGDSHAALFGHGVRARGTVKATYGTGSSLMTLTAGRPSSHHGLASTVAWTTTKGGTAYALEGNISVSGQAAAFIAELLGLSDAAAAAELASTVDDANGVVFVPALVGLGAPYWASNARGLVTGLSLGTKRAHVARAAIEAIAHQVADVFEAMQADLNFPLLQIAADGGASRNDALMQFQADMLGRPVTRGDCPEVSALGAAMMAAQGLGRPISAAGETTIFKPRKRNEDRTAARSAWRKAVQQTLLHASSETQGDPQ